MLSPGLPKVVCSMAVEWGCEVDWSAWREPLHWGVPERFGWWAGLAVSCVWRKRAAARFGLQELDGFLWGALQEFSDLHFSSVLACSRPGMNVLLQSSSSIAFYVPRGTHSLITFHHLYMDAHILMHTHTLSMLGSLRLLIEVRYSKCFNSLQDSHRKMGQLVKPERQWEPRILSRLRSQSTCWFFFSNGVGVAKWILTWHRNMLFAVWGLRCQFPLFFTVHDELYSYQFADLGCTVKILLMGYLPGSKHALLCASVHCKSDVQVYQLKIS